MSSIEKAVEKLKNKKTNRVETPTEQHISEAAASSQQDKKRVYSNNSEGSSAQKNKSIFPILRTLELHNMVRPNLKDNRQVEEYRQIKRPLLSNVMGKNRMPVDKGNVIMVTSAFPNEGKTYSAINLAMSIATERDYSVLVVDCDVIKQSLSSMFGLGNLPGLIDILENGNQTLKDVIITTDVPSLKILPAGQAHNHSTELLSSAEMGRVIDEMAAHYTDRIIIFDSPPLLMTSQSAVLSAHAGQVLVIVEEGVTPQQSVIDTISQIDKNKVIGVVLNKRSRLNRGDQYGGYYGSQGE